MKITRKKEEELKSAYWHHNAEYFQEHPTHGVHLSFGEAINGNAINPYLGIEDENGNAVTGYDERIEN